MMLCVKKLEDIVGTQLESGVLQSTEGTGHPKGRGDAGRLLQEQPYLEASWVGVR